MSTSQAKRTIPITKAQVQTQAKPYPVRPLAQKKPLTPKQTVGYVDLDEVEPEPVMIPKKPTAAISFAKVGTLPTMRSASPVDLEAVKFREFLAEHGWQNLDTLERKVSSSAKNPGKEYWQHGATNTWLGWVEEGVNMDPPQPWIPMEEDVLNLLPPFGWDITRPECFFTRKGKKDHPEQIGLYMKDGYQCENVGVWDPLIEDPDAQLIIKPASIPATDKQILLLTSTKPPWNVDGLTVRVAPCGPKSKRPNASAFWIRDGYDNPASTIFACYADGKIFPPSKKKLVELDALRR